MDDRVVSLTHKIVDERCDHQCPSGVIGRMNAEVSRWRPFAEVNLDAMRLGKIQYLENACQLGWVRICDPPVDWRPFGIES